MGSRPLCLQGTHLLPALIVSLNSVLSRMVTGASIGTNLGLFPLRWMLLSGRLLQSRGAVIPGLATCGLIEAAVRRAWAALAYGAWHTPRLLAAWQQVGQEDGRWQAHWHGGYCPVADVREQDILPVYAFIFRMQPMGVARPHYDDKPAWKEPFRIHMPITTNNGALLIADRRAKHLDVGEVWTFDNQESHAVVNGDAVRTHLIRDVKRHPKLDALLLAAQFDPGEENAEMWERSKVHTLSPWRRPAWPQAAAARRWRAGRGGMLPAARLGRSRAARAPGGHAGGDVGGGKGRLNCLYSPLGFRHRMVRAVERNAHSSRFRTVRQALRGSAGEATQGSVRRWIFRAAGQVHHGWWPTGPRFPSLASPLRSMSIPSRR